MLLIIKYLAIEKVSQKENDTNGYFWVRLGLMIVFKDICLLVAIPKLCVFFFLCLFIKTLHLNLISPWSSYYLIITCLSFYYYTLYSNYE